MAFAIFDGFAAVDLSGPHSVFGYPEHAAYEQVVVASQGSPVAASRGLKVCPDRPVSDVDPAEVDTLVVAGGKGVLDATRDRALIDWVRAVGGGARRVASVCSGAYLLAEAGLLDGRRATTHWKWGERLARAYPAVTVDCDPIFIRDGRVWTSAGVTAGMDLALAMVEEDHGRQAALNIAREMVLYLRRPGTQSQFSVPLWSTKPAGGGLRTVVETIQTNPGQRHQLADLAALAGLSPRHFQRRFTSEVGMPPATYVERIRMEAAQRALVEGDDPVEAIARRYGFGTAETLRRTFHRQLSVSPSDYRDRFRTAGV